VSEHVELFTSSSKRERGRGALLAADTVTIRVCDDEGRSICRTLTAGEWSRLIANPKQA
jgi:hypothetical protein